MRYWPKHLLTFMTLVLALAGVPSPAQVGGTGTAFHCRTFFSIPANLRAEGYAERVGDITLNCTGGTPTAISQPIPQANITVVLNTNITSRILSNTGSEALLLLDEPGSTANPLQQLCASLSGCVVPGTGGVGEPFSGTDATRPNIFQGVVSGNSVTFFGIPVDPPGVAGTRVFRITNIRANATALPSGTVASGFLPQVLATISTNPPSSVPIDNSQVPVGYVATGLTFASGVFGFQTCAGINDSNRSSIVSFSENFPYAFRPQAAEAGFSFSGLPGAGVADSGTRFKTVFRNIPAGVNVWVSTSSFGASAASTALLTASEIGPYKPVASTSTLLGTDVAQLPVVNGAATAIWEVTASNPSDMESFSFSVILTSSSTAPLNAGAATMTVNGSFAPSPPAFLAADAVKPQAAPFPIPRFADTSTPSNMMTVTPCTTSLLFPFVTTQSGFETGLSISSTSKDPFGTAPESGPCTLNFFGLNAPNPVTTQPVAAGATYATVLSSVSPNFQGYLIAVCNFEFAHGFVFISDLGMQQTAMGYLAVVLQGPRALQNTTNTENGLP